MDELVDEHVLAAIQSPKPDADLVIDEEPVALPEFADNSLLTIRFAKALRNERLAPELLRYEGAIVNAAMSSILNHARAAHQLRDAGALDDATKLTVDIVELDVARCKYILRQYEKARLDKVERFAMYLLHAHYDGESNMTPAEADHAASYVHLWRAHMWSQVLNKLYSSFDEVHEHPGPDLSTNVFVYVNEDCGPVHISGSKSVFLPRGTQHFVRYAVIRQYLAEGRVDLI